jgi:preprotein translocase subunit YajC
VNIHLLLQTSATDGGGPTIFGIPFFFIQIGLIVVIFYFLLIRPQGAARKKHAELLSSLKKGDEVMTSGGVIGRVRDIREVEVGSTKETRVTIESGTSTLVVERTRIVRVGGVSAPGAAGAASAGAAPS